MCDAELRPGQLRFLSGPRVHANPKTLPITKGAAELWGKSLQKLSKFSEHGNQ